ncbi:MAG: efflux RND transporter periplasmic adaptor subunit [Vicinamibacterales bacterium]|jgi:cobalt-zinc-cadmium efflux system membrane fusion protein
MTACFTNRALRPAAALACLLGVGACTGAVPPPEGASPAAAGRPEFVKLTDDAIKNAGIAVEAVQTRTRTDRLLAPGLLALDESRTARIGSLQEGLILETLAQVGDRVRGRQLLATMHGHALHDAWAGYRKAIADRRRLDKELAYAVDAHERARRLYADKAISLQEMQRAEVERVSATQLLDMSKAEVNRSIEELEHVGVSVAQAAENDPQTAAEETNEQIPVRSPIGGVVLERLVTQGTTVTPGTPLFVVSELSTLWAVAEIDESLLSRVRTGRPVDVLVAAYPNERFAGTITFIADVVNPKTRRITVRSTVPNADGRLKPEMFATVALGESEPRQMVVVPKGAIQTIEGRTTVFVAGAGGRFSLRAVELAAEADDLIEVKSGLTTGERIVVAGSFVLKSELLKPAAEGGN